VDKVKMSACIKGRLSLLRSAGALVIAAAGCASPPPAAPYLAAPIPAGMARIWFYRDANPNDLLAEAYIRLNGKIVGVTEPGAAFYRDVPPGSYHISVDSYVQDPHNERDTALVPGTEAYAKVLPLDSFVQSVGPVGGGYRRNNFVVWLYPPEVARPSITRSYFQPRGT
jgi:hypothetical protein